MPPRTHRLSLSSRLNLALYRCTVGALARIRPPRPSVAQLGPTSRVLVFSSAGLGDSLLDSVAFRALAETFPGIHLEAVVHHRRPDMSRHNPLIARLHFLKKGPHEFLRLLAELRAAGPWDAILYLSCHDPEARCLGYLLRRDATFGLARRTDFGHVCAHNLDDPTMPDRHLARLALEVAGAVGAKTSYPRMVYEVTEADRRDLDVKLAGMAVPLRPRVTFQLGGGGGPFRDWPAGHFVELAKQLVADKVGPIFLLGGPDHRAKSEEVMAALGGVPVYNVTARLALPLSAALVERSACLVSTDTGIMHLGFAVGTPTVALLHCRPGAHRVGPLADLDRHEVIELPKPPGYREPSDARMRDIPPEVVAAAVKRILARSGTAG